MVVLFFLLKKYGFSTTISLYYSPAKHWACNCWGGKPKRQSEVLPSPVPELSSTSLFWSYEDQSADFNNFLHWLFHDQNLWKKNAKNNSLQPLYCREESFWSASAGALFVKQSNWVQAVELKSEVSKCRIERPNEEYSSETGNNVLKTLRRTLSTYKTTL